MGLSLCTGKQQNCAALKWLSRDKEPVPGDRELVPRGLVQELSCAWDELNSRMGLSTTSCCCIPRGCSELLVRGPSANRGCSSHPGASPGGSVLSETGSGALGKSGLSPHTKSCSQNEWFSELQEEMSPPSPLSPHTKNCALKGEARMKSAMTFGVGIAGRWLQADCPPLPWVNNDLGSLSPFQKAQQGQQHSHQHAHAPCV